MNKQDIQTVLDALKTSAHYLIGYSEHREAAITICEAALARVDKPLEPSEPVYIRRDQLQKARRQAYLCEVGPEPRKDKVAVFTHPAPSKQPTYGWLIAADEELVCAHLGVTELSDSFETAKTKLKTLIDWHVAVATDPAVNGGLSLKPSKHHRCLS